MERTLAYLLTMSVGALCAAICFLCCFPLRRKRLHAAGLSDSPLREIVLALFWMFCGGMVPITIMPRWVIWSFVDLTNGYSWNAAGYPFFSLGNVNLTPFRTFSLDFHSLYILAGNILMFLPFGLFPALLFRRFGWKRALLTGALVTLFIECCQLSVGRTFDIDDLLLNTLGAFLGFLAAQVCKKCFPKFSAALTASPK